MPDGILIEEHPGRAGDTDLIRESVHEVTGHDPPDDTASHRAQPDPLHIVTRRA
jgi:hypothetical protein